MPVEKVGPNWAKTHRNRPAAAPSVPMGPNYARTHPGESGASGGDQWSDSGAGQVTPEDWKAAFLEAQRNSPSILQRAQARSAAFPQFLAKPDLDNPLTRAGGMIRSGEAWPGAGPSGPPRPKKSALSAISQAILRGGAETGYNPTGSVLPAPGELPGHSPNDAEPDADGDDGGLERIKQLLLNTVPQGGLDASGPKFDPASPEPSFVGPERPSQPHRSRWGALGQAILRGTRAAFQH